MFGDLDLRPTSFEQLGDEIDDVFFFSFQTRYDDPTESNGSWDWETAEEKTAEEKTAVSPRDSSSDLRSTISSLESEKNDLLLRLEQLDTENQINLSKVVDMRSKLQDELNDLKEDYLKAKQQNKNFATKEEKLKNELKELQKRLGQEEKESTGDDYKEKYAILTNLNKLANQRENKAQIEKIKVLEGENKIIYTELQRTKEQITFFEKKSLEDEDTCQKLAVILETYEKQVSNLKQEVDDLKAHSSNDGSGEKEDHLKLAQELELLKSEKDEHEKLLQEMRDLVASQQDEMESLTKQNNDLKSENELLQTKANGRMDFELENELENIQKEHGAQLGILQEELDHLKNQEAKNIAGEREVNELQERIRDLEKEISDMREQNEDLDVIHGKVLLELHNRYVNIITENIKKFQNYEKPSDLQPSTHEDDLQVAEFSKQVENIMKILLELKCKCDTLERKVIDLSEGKNQMLVEKNHEIEKLMSNSEILSQEILMKSKSLKELENECSELAKNNDLLISDLEAYKNNSVLQTISESNEDNVILLESQLENANKRIEDLERIIDDFEKQQMEKSASARGSDSSRESELVNKEQDYQRLLNNFDLLQVEHDSLNSDLEAARDYLQAVTDENRELKFSLDKVKSDYENTEYQLTEMNFNTEGLKEELQLYKNKGDLLKKEKEKFKHLSEENKATSEDLRCKLITEEEKLRVEESTRKDLEMQVRNLTEKLQCSKMAETSLKLQYEQKSKEAVALSEVKYNLEMSLNKINQDLAHFQNNFAELQTQNDGLIKDHEELKIIASKRKKEIKNLENFMKELEEKLATEKNVELLEDTTDGEKLRENVVNPEEILEKLSISETNKAPVDVEMKETRDDLKLMTEKNDLQPDLDKQAQPQTQLNEALDTCTKLQQQLQDMTNSRNELINVVTTKHQESVAYHNEIQRLNQILAVESEKVRNLENSQTKNEEIEKLSDQNNFLKEKCEVMAKNLLEEQSKVQQLLSEKSALSEKESSLQKNLDRLQSHLVEIEEHYTQELLQSEQKNNSLQARVTELEEREKNSSTMYTSVSIRANQQVESLQKQLQMVTNERDSLRRQISDAEDEKNKQAAALANLQFVLEQFRKDKERDVFKETERIRRQIAAEKQVQEELKKDISSLKSQLEESNQGLLAASRLSDQLELSKKTVSMLRDEVSQLQSKLSKTEEDLKDATSQTDGKVDKSLVKNLVIGFVTSNNNLNKDQIQILKIIATVLDFNQQDHDKVNLNKAQQGSWLSSFLAPQPGKMSEESLSQAFVKFLENESKPRIVPSLLNSTAPETSKATSSRTTPRQSPIVLSEIVLPTFADFAQNRNSSSILKDVLKDSS
ncbi:hypothetical protein JTB14_035424 [Gonioctena quinquepunctata]|nr:hypothetical protein JTB14_035424 [Gonioctena quinquepunctata]